MDDIEIVRKARELQAKDAMREAAKARDHGDAKTERRELAYAFLLIRANNRGR
jgi:hypothetical protein